MRASTPTVVRPLLKWAGGKRQLLPVLAEHYPPTFSRYIEPFMGSAAVFLTVVMSVVCWIVIAGPVVVAWFAAALRGG